MRPGDHRQTGAAGAEGVVLGCTELELLVAADDSPVPLFPTTSLHAAAAVNLALANRAEDGLELLEASPESEVAVRLLARYYEELAIRFPGGFDVDRTVAAPSAELRPPSGCFLIVRLDGRPVGCGAVRKLDETTAEIKRMWSIRRYAVVALVAGCSSAWSPPATRLGCQLVRLDTSSHLPEALGSLSFHRLQRDPSVQRQLLCPLLVREVAGVWSASPQGDDRLPARGRQLEIAR